MHDCFKAIGVWFLRMLLRILWTACYRDKQDRSVRVGSVKNLTNTIINKQIRFIGHVHLKEKLDDISLTVMITDRRAASHKCKHTHAMNTRYFMLPSTSAFDTTTLPLIDYSETKSCLLSLE